MRSQVDHQWESRVQEDFDTQQLQLGAAKISDGVLNTVELEKARAILSPAGELRNCAVSPPGDDCKVEMSSGSCRSCESRSREGSPGE